MTEAATTEPGFRPRGLGETVIRVRDLDRVQAFYQDVLGLEFWRRFDDRWVFFRIAPGHGGHTQIVGLFRDDVPSSFDQAPWPRHDPQATTLHHLALEIALDDYEAARDTLTERGARVTERTYPWCGWRSLYVRDPEGNVIELVCYDPEIDEGVQERTAS